MILSVDILLLAVSELEQRIEKEFVENPALEIGEPGEAEFPASAASPPKPELPTEDLFAKIDSFQNHHSSLLYDAAPRKSRPGDSDDRLEMLQNTEGKPPGLKDLLSQQLRLQSLDRELQEIGEEIINNLDHRGYLLSTADEIFASMQEKRTRGQFDQALAAVRSLDPPGVGAEDLKQCLLLQLTGDGEYPLETQIIQNHLEDLRQNKIPKIAKDLGATLDEIKNAVDIITSLDPLPGCRFESAMTVYIRPDIMVEKIDGQIQVRVENGSIPPMYISGF